MNSASTILFCIIMMTVFILLFCGSFFVGTTKECRKIMFKKSNIIIFLIIVVIEFMLICFVLSKNQFVYYWDFGGYWNSSYTQMKSLFQNPYKAINNLYVSINESDYNLILPTLISLPLKIFGYTFKRYILVNYIMFLVPTWIVFTAILLKCNKNISEKNIYLIFFVIATYSVLFFAMLRGSIDIAVILPVTLSILLFQDYNPLEINRGQIGKSILISILLLTTFLFRRYFAYYVVGYGMCVFLYSVYVNIRSGLKSKRYIINSIVNLCIVGGIALTTLLIFFNKLVFRILSNNYSQQYEGWDTSFGCKVYEQVEHFGIINLCLFVVGIGYALYKKQNRKIAYYSLLSSIIILLMFYRVQGMSYHHYYLISVQIMIGIYLGMQVLSSIKINQKSVILVVLIATLCMQPINYFSENFHDRIGKAKIFFSKEYTVLKRGDLSELRKLVKYITKLQEKGRHRSVYVLASGGELNHSILEMLDQPYATMLPDLLYTSDVDLRDGFPTQFLDADIVITTTPVQLHLSDGTQDVISYLRRQVIDKNSSIGVHFQKTKQEFKLDNNVIVSVYLKKTEIKENDLESTINYFLNKYPGQEALFYNKIKNYYKEY